MQTSHLSGCGIYLAEKSELDLNDQQMELLEIVTDFNLEARYPDEKFSFYKRCTKEFTVNYLTRIEEMKKWLLLYRRPILRIFFVFFVTFCR